MTNLESLRNRLPSKFARELLSEFYTVRWESPSVRSIEDVGVAHGFHVGLVRARNEDRIAVSQITTVGGQRFAVAIVCDGVGGSELGDVAATLAVVTFLSELSQARDQHPLPLLLSKLIQKVDDNVRNQLNGRGTTTLSVIVRSAEGEIAAANVGDSRIFAWSPRGGSLVQVSIDDTMENAVKLLAKDDSFLAAHGLRGRLSQAIGESGRRSADLKIVIYGKAQFPRGAVLATDGAWKADAIGFERILSNAGSADEAVRRSLTFANWVGGIDNVSIIAIEDLAVFAEHGVIAQLGIVGRATVWISDFKFAVSGSDAAYSNSNLPFDDQIFDTLERSNPKKKAQSRRKAYSKISSHDSLIDLKIMPGPETEAVINLSRSPRSIKASV